MANLIFLVILSLLLAIKCEQLQIKNITITTKAKNITITTKANGIDKTDFTVSSPLTKELSLKNVWLAVGFNSVMVFLT